MLGARKKEEEKEMRTGEKTRQQIFPLLQLFPPFSMNEAEDSNSPE